MAQPTRHIFSYFVPTIQQNWERFAFSNYDGNEQYTYEEVALCIVRMHIYFREAGIEKGDKIAICGGNSARWAISFLSVVTYGAVAVSILPDFIGADIEKLVNHSDTKILFLSQSIIRKVEFSHMLNVKAIFSLTDFSEIYSTSPAYSQAFKHIDEIFHATYPKGFRPQDVCYEEGSLDDLALINYTSGTSSSPKGVMLSHRNLGTNLTFSMDHMYSPAGSDFVSILPLAHMFGLMIELIYNFASGVHIHFVTRLNTSTLLRAYKEYPPLLILTVPLVLEKIYEKHIKPQLSKPYMRMLWNTPFLNQLVKKYIRKQLLQLFGGKLDRMITGGAAISEEVEHFFLDIHFPFLVGYGMTEAAPLVGYVAWKEFVPRSCGRLVDRMQIRIDSSDEMHIPGEILLKGDAIMLGYYKNKEATQNAFTDDGWMRTGDMGVIDQAGNIYLRGRCKNLILGASGQNIYPEEIEGILNLEDIVEESIVVNRDNKLVALIYPCEDAIRKNNSQELFQQCIQRVNRKLPTYSRIASYEIRNEAFAKTPKHSIKRFLYH